MSEKDKLLSILRGKTSGNLDRTQRKAPVDIEVFRAGREVRKREKEWKYAKETVQATAQRPIEKGILDMVVALKVHGLPVVESCEGHPDSFDAHAPGDDHPKSPIPWLLLGPNIDLPDDLLYEEGLRLENKAIKILGLFYEDRKADSGTRLIVIHQNNSFILTNQGTYTVEIEPGETRASKIAEYTGEMEAFKTFLYKDFIYHREIPSRFPEEFQ